ncbi:MAG: hypothetical protein ACXWUG_12335, partial [Polyangiales bacterium]
ALRQGDMKFVFTTDHVADEPDAGLLAYERAIIGGGAIQYALVVINTSAKHDSTATFPVRSPDVTLVDQLAPSGGATAKVAAGSVTVTVPKMSAVIFMPEGTSIQ